MKKLATLLCGALLALSALKTEAAIIPPGGGGLNWLTVSNLAYNIAVNIAGTGGISAVVGTNIANAQIAASNALWVARLNSGSTNQELHEATVKGYLNFDAPNSFIEVENWLWQLYVGPDLRSRIDINTNNGHIGFNTYGDTNLMVASWTAYGQAPPTTNTTVTTRDTQGAVYLLGGVGRDTTATTTGTAGQAGRFQAIGGNGGSAPLAQTNSTGGTGGTAFLIGGFGGNDYLLHPSYAATNANTGGNGGPVQILGGTPGIPGNLAGTSATNTVTGNGGAVTINGGTSESPQGGWTRKTGTGGGVSITGGSSGDSTRTNSGNAGAITITGGSSGNATTSGNPGTPGSVNIVGGNGGTGDTNAFGGSITLLPGDGGGAAADGNVLLGVNLAGTARGKVGVGTNNPQSALHVHGDLTVNGGLSVTTFHTDALNILSNRLAVADAANHQFDLSLPWKELEYTNSMTQGTRIAITNAASTNFPTLRVEVEGAAAVSNFAITNTFPSGDLAQLNGGALAESITDTVTNGWKIEDSWQKTWKRGTNIWVGYRAYNRR